MTEDELLHQKGAEAEDFIKYTEENKYFIEVMADIQKDLMDRIIGLRPWQKDEFSLLKSQIECLYLPLNRVRVDAELGKQSYNRMNGIVDMTEGIL
jgi:hypothetical protein